MAVIKVENFSKTFKVKLKEKGLIIIEILETILGAFIMSISVSLFLLPNELSSGGFSGIATILYYIFKLPVGTTILISSPALIVPAATSLV